MDQGPFSFSPPSAATSLASLALNVDEEVEEVEETPEEETPEEETPEEE